VALLESLLGDVNTTVKTKEFILTALMKLTSRFQNIERIKELVTAYRSHLNVELQQRSCEYHSIFEYPESAELRYVHPS
jgi:AP-1 complex subunit gamma-1